MFSALSERFENRKPTDLAAGTWSTNAAALADVLRAAVGDR